MEATREVARKLARAGIINIMQKGQVSYYQAAKAGGIDLKRTQPRVCSTQAN